MKKIRTVIIDDLSLARKSLAADLALYCPVVEIVGEAESVVSGFKLVKKVEPELVFLDIHLGDGDGFDLLEMLDNNAPKIIFTTASDQHAIKAFRFSAIDYLLKPIDPESLVQAVEKTMETITPSINVNLAKANYKSPSKLVLHTTEIVKVVDLNDIIRLESMGNYTQFFFKDKGKLLITKTLKEYDELLSQSSFLRVHQSHLINLNHLKSYVKTEGGYLSMVDDARIPVSVRKKASVLAAIDDFAQQ